MGEGEEEQLIPESGEILAESADETGGDESAALQIQKLREKLKKAVAEKQEYLEGWQRARADFVNFKKEEGGREKRAEERFKSEFAEAVIPTLDSLESALKNHPTKELELLQKQLLQSLAKIGVERFGAVGEEFDPRRHEALAQKGDAHTVVSLERSGYSIGLTNQGEKIIRPAQVTLGNNG